VLNAAAVIGPRVEHWLLADVTQTEAGAMSESLDVGMLRAQGDMLAFHHELARLAILDSIAPHQRAFLHQATLDALKASPLTRSDVCRLAHHAAAAGDEEAILSYAPAAAEHAQTAGMFRTARTLYALAIRHSSELPALRRAAFFAAFAAASHDNPNRAEIIRAYRQAVALAKEGGDLLLAGNSLSRMAVLLLMEGETTEAVRAVDEALAMLETLEPSPPLAVAHKTRAFLHLISGENEQAVARARSCLQVAVRLESASLHIEAYHALGICSLPLNHAQGCDYLEKSLALVLEEDAYWAAGSVHADLLMTYVDIYGLDRAEELISSGLHITAEHDLDLSWLVIHAWQSILLVYRGRYQEAEEIAGEVLARPDSMEVFRVPALVALAWLRARRVSRAGSHC